MEINIFFRIDFKICKEIIFLVDFWPHRLFHGKFLLICKTELEKMCRTSDVLSSNVWINCLKFTLNNCRKKVGTLQQLREVVFNSNMFVTNMSDCLYL